MGLTSRCRHNFTLGAIARGERYYRERRVRLVSATESSAHAEVRGRARKPYSVSLDWSEAADEWLLFHCSCPQGESGNLCKHLYALLLDLEQRGVEISGRAPLMISPEFGADPDGWDDDDSDAEGPAAGDSAPAGSAPAAPRGPHWTQPLQSIHASLSPAADPEPPPRRVEGEVRYLLDLATAATSGNMALFFATRTRGRGGSWNAPKRLKVDRDARDLFPDPEDQAIFCDILGAELHEEEPGAWGWLPGNGSRKIAHVVLRPSQLDSLLPRLCRTGRLTLIARSARWQDLSPPAAWDGERPWNFRLRIERSGNGESWQLSGELGRDGEICPISRIGVLWRHGLFLVDSTFHRLAGPPAFGWIATLGRHGAIEVPVAEQEQLLERLWNLPHLPELDWPEELKREIVQGSPRPHARIGAGRHTRRGDFLEAEITFDYDGHRIDPSSGLRIVTCADGVLLLRDRDRETAIRREVLGLGLRPSVFHDEGSWFFELASGALPSTVRALLGAGFSVQADGKVIRSARTPRLTVTSGVDWFDLDGEATFDDASVPFPEVLRAIKSGRTTVTLGDGSEGMIPEEWLRRYGPLADLGKEVDGRIRFARAQTALLNALLAEEERLTVDEPFAELRERLRDFSGIRPAAPVRGFRGTLRPYQKDGLGWLHFIRRYGFGGCLADDMGLGKTVQVLALLQERCPECTGGAAGPSLVVAPRSVVHNWCEEAARFTPRLKILDYTGLDRAGLREQIPSCDLVITTYGTLRRDILHLREVRFHYAILDEAQNIKNGSSQAAKAARLLPAAHRLALTGTPVENHLGELWSLFEFLNPGMLGSSTWMRALGARAKGRDERTARLVGQALRPFLLRRTKEAVLPDLPKKTEQTLVCEMDGAQRRIYDELREHYRAHLFGKISELGLARSQIYVLEALLRLRQAACHAALIDPVRREEKSAKLEALEEQLGEIHAEGHKALVFSQFTSFLSLVRDRLERRGLAFEYLDGATRDRAERIRRFQEDPGCAVFLISLKAGGTGLNLTAADYVFILDPWWNPAVEAQAVDRTHRIGQVRPVFAYRLICRDTVEEKILELQKEKRVVAEAILTEDHSLMRTLTAEDLEMLLG